MDEASTLPKRKAVNLTIRTDIMDQARSLQINASKAAESGLQTAISKAKETIWIRKNKEAILAHNERTDITGLLLQPEWMQE